MRPRRKRRRRRATHRRRRSRRWRHRSRSADRLTDVAKDAQEQAAAARRPSRRGRRARRRAVDHGRRRRAARRARWRRRRRGERDGDAASVARGSGRHRPRGGRRGLTTTRQSGPRRPSRDGSCRGTNHVSLDEYGTRGGRISAVATLADRLARIIGTDLPVGILCFDGSRLGPPDPPATVVVRSPDAVRRIVAAPGELGFARAYVAGDLDIEGDVFAALELRDHFADVSCTRATSQRHSRVAGPRGVRPLPPPPEEVRLRGRRHSPARDAAAIEHHYDVSNDFYRMRARAVDDVLVRGVVDSPKTLEDAQAAKHELICRKLGLAPGHAPARRRLRAGAAMVMHAAAASRRAGGRRHGLTPSGRARRRSASPRPA